MRSPLHPLLAIATVAIGIAEPAATVEQAESAPNIEVHRDETEIVTVRPAPGLTVTNVDGLDDLAGLDGVTVDGTLDQLGLVRVELTGNGRAALEASGLIDSVLADHRLQLFLDTSTTVVEADAAEAAGFNGEGSLVAVIDSGVDPDQGAFGNRIVAEACFLSAVATPFDEPSQLCPGGTSRAPIAVLRCRARRR